MDKIIEKIEALRKEILNDKNVCVFDKGLYCVELMDIRLEVEELELKSDLLNPVIETCIHTRCNNLQSKGSKLCSTHIKEYSR